MSRLLEDVAGATHRLQQPGFATGLQFLTEIADVDVHHVAGGVAIQIPNRFRVSGNG